MKMCVARTDAFGGADFATTRLRLPWGPDEGLFVFDQFGHASPIEVPLPDDLVRRGMFPYVILSTHDGESALLAQKWFDRPITSWQLIADAGVDAASVCLTPRAVANGISGHGLREAESVVQNAPDLWAQVALDTHPVLGVRITLGDGAYPLRLALDANGVGVGWVLELGVVETK
jgi:hypothetical protein